MTRKGVARISEGRGRQARLIYVVGGDCLHCHGTHSIHADSENHAWIGLQMSFDICAQQVQVSQPQLATA